MERIEFIKESFSQGGMAISDSQAKQFLRYFEMLVEKNQVMNLTAITEFSEVVQKHFLDSYALWCDGYEFEKAASGLKVIDVGTGAGFPGMVLKILKPEIQLTLLDTLQKRLDFLEETAYAIDLPDITYVHARAEDGAKDVALRE